MTEPAQRSRLETLLDLLQSDPDNLRLLSDAADTAFAEGRLDQAAALVDRYADIAPPPASLINILGLTALEDGRVADAARIFQSLLDNRPDDPGLIFNLAWAQSRLGAFEEVDRLVDAELAAANPTAAALKVRSLHHLGRPEEALALGDRLETIWSGQPDLMGALASAALDAGDMARARRWGDLSADTPDGRATSGMLALAEGRDQAATDAFEIGLAHRPDSARNLLGLGLVRMRNGDLPGAASALDRSAAIFADHPGTWIAAGWAHFLAGDMNEARICFERARDIDPSFAEVHGALAVVQLMQGEEEDARRSAATARRLDRETLGGALAAMLLAQSEGRDDLAVRIRETALTMPIGPEGQTLSQALAQMAITRPGLQKTHRDAISR